MGKRDDASFRHRPSMRTRSTPTPASGCSAPPAPPPAPPPPRPPRPGTAAGGWAEAAACRASDENPQVCIRVWISRNSQEFRTSAFHLLPRHCGNTQEFLLQLYPPENFQPALTKVRIQFLAKPTRDLLAEPCTFLPHSPIHHPTSRHILFEQVPIVR